MHTIKMCVMNRGIFTSALLATALFTACTKENLVDFDLNSQSKTEFTISPTAPSVYASAWESSASWQSGLVNGLQNYSFNRPTRQVSQSVMNNGLVLAFAKGYNFLGTGEDDKPIGTPFYFSLAEERFVHPYYYYLHLTEGNIKTNVSMHATLESPFASGKNNLQFRYFVIPPEFLSKYSLSASTVKNKSYDEIVSLLHTTP